MNKTIDGVVKTGLTNQVIGKRYTLRISNLEQVIKTGDYIDYSGVITVAIKASMATDTTGNGNVGQTITSGVNIPGGSGTGTVVDVVDPLWEQVGLASAKPSAKTAEITVRVTDKYFVAGSFTSSNVKVYVNGALTTSGITVTITEDTSVTLTYGKQYIIKITGYSSSAYQLKITIDAGLFPDQSGNTTKETTFILFSALKNTSAETSATSAFLQNPYSIQRQKVEKIIFEDYIGGTSSTRWDASVADDGSIQAWYETTSRGTYIVHIGSPVIINGNVNSSYLFSYIGNSSSCATTGDTTSNPIIENLDLLHVDSVTNMSYMFNYFGSGKMKSFDLGESFDTSNVTNMEGMFQGCGYTAMTSFDFGEKFNINKVTNMKAMFKNFGYTAMPSLNLTNIFNLNTANSINMESMFEGCGYTKMTSLNLGTNFNTSKITNMKAMFKNCGYTLMPSLDLGNLFYTTSATDMTEMFYKCGYTAMTTIDLGPVFTRIASTNTNFATDCGKSGAVIYAPESIYSKMKLFKLGTNSTTTVSCNRATINPIYRPEWSKVSSTLDITTGNMTIVVKGSAYKQPNSFVNYASNVTHSVNTSNITVYVDNVKADGVKVDSVVKTNETTNAAGKTEVEYTINLSGFEQTRPNGKFYKEWSGNVSVQLAKGTLTDEYGNKNLAEIDIDTSGTMDRIEIEDATTNKNTTGIMFDDVIRPELTYKYSETTIDKGNKVLTVVF